ncbi:ethanolamine ammonia-lyase subunit EutC [[Clostridium] symbiosum]|uniref:ethanolamine ammonia-lyase subunit EutC n=1 Tax=Clostridium symbiosum TaxID=1512 RepID=UPI001D071A63|nr:ethanolamine ammonia-lyase subunit EutC [[Clostridium] symbiosum]MCB6608568.1 ethanolamine ammonia-lyase subunit EutC [[Clostridium] symbiosum]MCB6932120.1 ethanolamine ammonia-lyase subunit EutC [[Clostridium] symbiosum]
MLRQTEIDRIAEEILTELQGDGRFESGSLRAKSEAAAREAARQKAKKELEEVAGSMPPGKPDGKDAGDGLISEPPPELDRKAPLLENPQDPDALRRMIGKTTARIGVGRSGPRLKTKTLLTLRADHAAARDAVLMDVSEELIQKLGLFSVATCCTDKNNFLTRPDLGRDFDEETKAYIKEKCVSHPDVQIIISDGLSSSAIEANAARILPVVMEGLKEKGLKAGTPIFVKYGRVGAQDRISELVGAKVVCSFIGERPGLATAESMSAYIAYHAEVGMPEARRTVVSNIHKDGVPAVEAGAYIVDLLALILEKQASGVDLKK